MQNSLISICIPSYNRPEELYRLLNSIDSKNKEKIEIIVCEDKSPKRYEINQKVHQYISETIYEVRYFENELNLGYDKNLRELVSKFTGNFIVFMGDDVLISKAFGQIAEKIYIVTQLGDVKASFADADDLLRDFDYKSNTALSDGIGEFARWHRENL